MKFELHSFAPLSTCDNNPDMYIGLQFVCCPAGKPWRNINYYVITDYYRWRHYVIYSDGGNGLNDGGSVSGGASIISHFK